MVHLVQDNTPAQAVGADEEALGWVVRLSSGEATAEDYDNFRHWRDESKVNAAALIRARTLWLQLGAALPTAERQRRRRLSEGFARKAAVGLAGAAAVLLCIGVGQRYWSNWRYDAATSVGQVKTVILPDGSRVMLGGDTALNIDYRHGARAIQLARGEALFSVIHDPNRPFTVRAGIGEIRDVGTVFDIKLQGEGARIVVAQGAVEVASNGRRTPLVADRSLSLSPARFGPVTLVNAKLETAWSRGSLMLENTSLSDIIAALGPYYDGKIVLLNKAADHERLNAAIDLNRLDGWLSGLAKTHSLHLMRFGGVTVLW